ncbi:hypothetical protein FRB99_001326 [Tulasnella sp. 403]|nr:hypothetical protein FRB99_001326 [Tulasnella sp. 403]
MNIAKLPPELLCPILEEIQAEGRAYDKPISHDEVSPDTLDKMKLINCTFNDITPNTPRIWSFIPITQNTLGVHRDGSLRLGILVSFSTLKEVTCGRYE